MALPPSKLKELLYTCSNADEVFTVLVEAGCLNRKARTDREGMHALVAQAAKRHTEAYAGDEGMTGPNDVDFLSDEIEGAGVLSRRGRRMAEEMAR